MHGAAAAGPTCKGDESQHHQSCGGPHCDVWVVQWSCEVCAGSWARGEQGVLSGGLWVAGAERSVERRTVCSSWSKEEGYGTGSVCVCFNKP